MHRSRKLSATGSYQPIATSAPASSGRDDVLQPPGVERAIRVGGRDDLVGRRSERDVATACDVRPGLDDHVTPSPRRKASAVPSVEPPSTITTSSGCRVCDESEARNAGDVCGAVLHRRDQRHLHRRPPRRDGTRGAWRSRSPATRRPRRAAARARAGPRPAPRRRARAQAGGDRLLVERIDEQRRVARDLGDRRAVRGHRRHARAPAPRPPAGRSPRTARRRRTRPRPGTRASRSAPSRPRVRTTRPGPSARELPPELVVEPPVGPAQHEGVRQALGGQAPVRPDQPRLVLPRLQRADRQHVRSRHAAAARAPASTSADGSGPSAEASGVTCTRAGSTFECSRTSSAVNAEGTSTASARRATARRPAPIEHAPVPREHRREAQEREVVHRDHESLPAPRRRDGGGVRRVHDVARSRAPRQRRAGP